jgi:glycosyltransferase involved in cell wall biosynthesis
VQLPSAPSIKHAGYVDDARLRTLLTGAAALVYPSRYEGFGLPPLEAWACGTPAIVGDTPALRESTQGRGTYVPPGDVSSLVEAMTVAVEGGLQVPEPPRWTWCQAAETLSAHL